MVIAFDLDDTLYKEADYVASGYRSVAEAIADKCHARAAAAQIPASADEIAAFMKERRPHGFEDAIEKYGLESVTVDDLDEIYRAHEPDIQLVEGALETLTALKAAGHTLVLITDGSSRRQRAKIRALGIAEFFDDIIISGETGADKTTAVPWQRAEGLLTRPSNANAVKAAEKPQYRRCVYIGDNPAKDFREARRRGWHTIMLRDTTGRNTHPQNLASLPPEYHPNTIIDTIIDILPALQFCNVGQNL